MGHMMEMLLDQCLAWEMGPARVAMVDGLWGSAGKHDTEGEDKEASLGLGPCKTVRLLEGALEERTMDCGRDWTTRS